MSTRDDYDKRKRKEELRRIKDLSSIADIANQVNSFASSPAIQAAQQITEHTNAMTTFLQTVEAAAVTPEIQSLQNELAEYGAVSNAISGNAASEIAAASQGFASNIVGLWNERSHVVELHDRVLNAQDIALLRLLPDSDDDTASQGSADDIPRGGKKVLKDLTKSTAENVAETDDIAFDPKDRKFFHREYIKEYSHSSQVNPSNSDQKDINPADNNSRLSGGSADGIDVAGDTNQSYISPDIKISARSLSIVDSFSDFFSGFCQARDSLSKASRKEDDCLSNDNYGDHDGNDVVHAQQYQLLIDFIECINLPKQERKKSQHYVFQAYMKAWEDQTLSKKDSKKVIVWASRGGDGYPVATDKIGFTNGFYSIPRLTGEEKTVLRIYWKYVFKYPDSTIKALEKHLGAEQFFYKLLDQLDAIQKISENIELDEDEKADIDKWISQTRSKLEVYNNNSMENFLSGVEADLMPYINHLKKLDSSFYYRPQFTEGGDSKHDFLNFVAIQYFRTKYLRDQVEDNYRQMAPLLAKNAGLDINHINSDHIIPVTFWAFQALLCLILPEDSLLLI